MKPNHLSTHHFRQLRAAVCGTGIMGLLFLGCTLFSPREVAPPDPGIRCADPALTGGQVLEYFEESVDSFPQCIAGNLLGVNQADFAFSFDTLDRITSANQATLGGWNGQDEKDFYIRLEARYRITAFTFSLRSGYQDQPDTVFYRTYSFVRTDAGGANPVTYGGWAKITAAQSGTKGILARWEDHKEGLAPTFGRLRDELLQ
jgi:hypothetical protein